MSTGRPPPTRRQTLGLLAAAPLAAACAPPVWHPRGDPAPDVPRPNGPTIRVDPETFAARFAAAPEGAHLVFAPGIYDGHSIWPKAGQRFEVDGNPGDATWRGAGQGHAMRGAAPEVSILGLRFIEYHLNAPDVKDEHNRLLVEDAVISLEREQAVGWVGRDVIIEDCRAEGVKVASGLDWRGGRMRNVSSCAMSGAGRNMRIRDVEFRDINTLRAASHHHSGAMKIVGGRRNFDYPSDHPDAFFPPTEDIEIIGCRGFNLINCRGLVWLDWDGRDVLIEDFLVDGSDFEGIAIEAWATTTVRNGVLRNTNRRGDDNPVWNTALALQNAQRCRVERVDIHRAHANLGGVGVMHHNRGDPDVNRLGINAGQTIGRFLGTDNHVHDCGFGGLDRPEMVVDAGSDFQPPTPEEVRASNRVTASRKL